MVTVGLDLHKRYITACAIDDAGGCILRVESPSAAALFDRLQQNAIR